MRYHKWINNKSHPIEIDAEEYAFVRDVSPTDVR